MKTNYSKRMRVASTYLLTALLLVSLGAAGILQVHGQQPAALAQRPLTPDDLSRMAQIGEQYNPFSFSPDGKELAFVFVRPITTSNLWPQNYLFGGDRSDIWIQSVAGGKPTNITNGEKDGSGFFMPSWSPDGKRLAMLSTRGSNLRLWLWEKASRRLHLLSERAVDLQSWDPPFLWVSADKIIYYAMPHGQTPTLLDQDVQAQKTATREWAKAWKGKESTASAVESGIPIRSKDQAPDDLILLDVMTGKAKQITSGRFRSLKLSPQKDRLAFLKQTSIFQGSTPSLTVRSLNRFSFMGYQLMVASTEGELLAGPVPQVNHVYSLDWSNDGRQIALIGEEPGSTNYRPNVYLYQLAGKSVRTVFEDTLDPPAAMWSARNELLVRTDRKSAGETNKTGESSKRVDWWLFPAAAADQAPRNLTHALSSAPLQLFEEPGGTFIGLAAGDLWRIPMDGTPPKKLSINLDGQITAIVWPNRPAAPQNQVTKLVVETKNKQRTDDYLLDLASERKLMLPKPDEAANLVYYNPLTDTAVMTANTRSGTFLWFSDPNSQKTSLLMEANTFLRTVAEGERRQIEYRSLSGRTLKAWLILPLHYQPAKRYPLIAWVRGGVVQGDVPPMHSNLNLTMPFTQQTLQLLAAHGYAVLFPSMPISDESNKLVDVTDGVLPALDKVIEMGIADPERLGVMGHSFGASTTYGLITQTNRFQAAVAMAGRAENISPYGQFQPRRRYTDFPQEYLAATMYIVESPLYGYGLEVPPWVDLERYVRNAPIFRVDRVETPVMIIHGDMDSSVPIEQGEGFFSALYRQNKRARFVRYWGEGHQIESPANVRDMWKQIFDWFDEFLMSADKPVTSSNK